MGEVEDSTTQATDPVDLHGEDARRTVESALLTIPGVTAVRLVPGFDRAVDELHVVTEPDRSPKQTVRDVQSFLYASYGISIDHRVVSVVQLDAGHDPERGADRPAITEVTLSQQELLCRATVRLRAGTEVLEGTAEGPSSSVGRRRAVGRATLEATGPLLHPYVAELEAATVNQVADHRVAVSVVQLFGSRGERAAAGSAIVGPDELIAVARSVLDAINREVRPG